MSIFKTFKKEMTWGGKTLSIETGKMSRQADGAVIVRYGDTMVHAAVCASKKTPDTFEDFIKILVKVQLYFKNSHPVHPNNTSLVLC